MKRAFVAIAVALALGTTPAAADDGSSAPLDPPTQNWQQPASSVTTDPQTLVEQSGDSGAMTVVYAVQDGDSLRIETEPARSPDAAADVIEDVQAEADVLAVEVDAPRRLTGSPMAPLPSADPVARNSGVWTISQPRRHGHRPPAQV